MNLDEFRVDDKNTYLFKPENCFKDMLHDLKNGKVRGTTTYNSKLDECWTWRTQEANIWTGYSNEGKSLFLKQLCLIKALEENKSLYSVLQKIFQLMNFLMILFIH